MARFLLSLFFLFIAQKVSSEITSSLDQLSSQASEYLRKDEYKKASAVLTKIIKLNPDDHQNYFKRASASFALKRFKKAISDLEKAIEKNPNYLAGYEYLAKSHKYLCNLKEAEKHLKTLKSKSGAEKQDEYAESIREIQGLGSEESVSRIECDGAAENNKEEMMRLRRFSEVCKYSKSVLLKSSECFFKAGEYARSASSSVRLIQIDKNDLDAYKTLAESYFYEGKLKGAHKVVKKGLRNDPENKQLKSLHKKLTKINRLLDEAATMKQRRRLRKQIDALNAAKELLPQNSDSLKNCLVDLCEASQKLGRNEKARELCTEALEIDSSVFRARKFRAKAQMECENFEEAVIDFKKANEIEGNHQDIINGYHEAKRLAKKAAMKDYYKILGVSKNADKNEIKKAYRKAALKWHPDRWRKAEDKKNAKKMFSDINEANKVLSDENMRRRYDRGENVYNEGENRGPTSDPRHFHFTHGNGGQFFFNF